MFKRDEFYTETFWRKKKLHTNLSSIFSTENNDKRDFAKVFIWAITHTMAEEILAQYQGKISVIPWCNPIQIHYE